MKWGWFKNYSYRIVAKDCSIAISPCHKYSLSALSPQLPTSRLFVAKTKT